MKRPKARSLILLAAMVLFSCAPSTDNKPEPYISGPIPNSFVCDGLRYEMERDSKVSIDDLGSFFGYLINERDLSHWRAYDNDPSIHYALESRNELYRRDCPGENLIDRYELFIVSESDCLALTWSAFIFAYIPIEE